MCLSLSWTCAGFLVVRVSHGPQWRLLPSGARRRRAVRTVRRRCDDGVRHTDRRNLPDSDSESFYCVRMSEKRRSRFGPAPKAGGARKQRTVRIPEGLDELVAAEAAELGVPIGDAVVAVLARGLGVAEPDYIRRNREQERLQGQLLDV